MLKIMAQLSPEDLDSVAMAWAAIGGDTATTQVPDTDGEDEGPEQSRAAGPLVGSDVEGFEALEELNVVAFAALKAGVELDFVAKADSIARKMSPTQQMTTAASLLRMARAAESEGSKKATKEETRRSSPLLSPMGTPWDAIDSDFFVKFQNRIGRMPSRSESMYDDGPCPVSAGREPWW
eukprot:g21179.t1